MMTKKKLVRIGSKTAKSGFRTEKDIVSKFDHWKKDEEVQSDGVI